MRTEIDFGKIAFEGKSKRNKVTIEIELRSRGGEEIKGTDKFTPVYTELSICGDIWNSEETDIVCGGQCLDTIREYRNQISDPELFDEIYEYWKKYHLNGMHAGTPEQEAAIEEWKQAGNKYDYDAVCDMLAERNLWIVNYSGKAINKVYENEPYKYGTSWLIEDIPIETILRIEHIIYGSNERKEHSYKRSEK